MGCHSSLWGFPVGLVVVWSDAASSCAQEQVLGSPMLLGSPEPKDQPRLPTVSPRDLFPWAAQSHPRLSQWAQWGSRDMPRFLFCVPQTLSRMAWHPLLLLPFLLAAGEDFAWRRPGLRGSIRDAFSSISFPWGQP